MSAVFLRLARSSEFRMINDIKLKGDSRYGAMLRPRPLPVRWLREAYEQNLLFILEEAGKGAIGFMLLMQKHGFLYGEQASVLPEYRGQRFAKRFLEQALKIAKKKGFAQIVFITNADVSWNAPYYATLGFSVLSENDTPSEVLKIMDAEQARGKLKRVVMGIDVS